MKSGVVYMGFIWDRWDLKCNNKMSVFLSVTSYFFEYQRSNIRFILSVFGNNDSYRRCRRYTIPRQLISITKHIVIEKICMYVFIVGTKDKITLKGTK